MVYYILILNWVLRGSIGTKNTQFAQCMYYVLYYVIELDISSCKKERISSSIIHVCIIDNSAMHGCGWANVLR